MNVRLEIQFDSPTAEDEASLSRLAIGLTNDRDSVLVTARKGKPDLFVAEFTMPTEAQYKAVEKRRPSDSVLPAEQHGLDHQFSEEPPSYLTSGYWESTDPARVTDLR